MLQSLTLAEARNLATLHNDGAADRSGGGQLLAFQVPDENSCAVMNYEPENACSGFFPNDSIPSEETSKLVDEKISHEELQDVYRCYAGDPSADFPTTRLFDYLDATSQSFANGTAASSTNGMLWQMQVIISYAWLLGSC